jgi:hypothetical protein
LTARLLATGITDELKAYPEDRLMAPLNERAAQWSATDWRLARRSQSRYSARDLKPVMQTHNRFAGLFTARKLVPWSCAYCCSHCARTRAY